MKFKHLFLSTILLGGAMASCSDDLDVSDKGPGQILENETTTYVRISIMGEGNTLGRAVDEPGYEEGDPDENTVNSVLLTFFDAGRNFVGSTTLSKSDIDKGKVEDGDGHTVSKMLTVIAQVELPENINYPKYVMAYVNPTSRANDLATETLEEVMRFIRPRNTVSPEGFRTMNNSVYFSNATGYSRYATEVDFKTHFFESEEKAKAATEATVEITVERMEAKVRLNNTLANIKSNVTAVEGGTTEGGEDKYSLTFEPEAWFVNATEKRSFLIKNYRSTRENFTGNIPVEKVDFGYTLSELNGFFGRGGSFSINDYANKRSYWAISPTYFYNDVAPADRGTIYPDVSYDVKYGETINPLGREYPLNYISFTDGLASYNYKDGMSTNYVKYENGVKKHEYVLENTQSINTLRGTDAKASMSSVVLLGHYIIKKGSTVVFDGSKPAGDNKQNSFYIRHEADKSVIVMLSDKEAVDFFIERSGSTFFVRSHNADGSFKTTTVKNDKGEDVVEYEYEPLRAAHLDPASDKNEHHVDYGVSYADFALVYPDKSVTNGKVQSEQWRTLNVTNAGKANSNIYVYDRANGGYKLLSAMVADADEWAEFQEKTMYSTFGVLEKFQAGKAYFNIPLKHIWGAADASNKFEADKVKLGDYGVVRNHVYDLTINKITGLGTGIGEVDQPIVPPTENEQFYISTRLNILKWRVVSQSVDL